MDKINEKLGTNYHLFNYYGADDADRVIVCMGSFCDTLEEVIDYLNAHGEKVGLVKVRLYRPWSVADLLAALPATVKKIAVLDRTKEPGASASPCTWTSSPPCYEAGKTDITVVGGRYGLGSKDTPPAAAFAVYKELEKDAPKHASSPSASWTTSPTCSLPEDTDAPNTAAPGTIECKFWGLGGDGTVGANKNSIKIIGDHTDKYVQAYFQYDSKKTGGVTISHLRFGDTPIRCPYYINKADFVACHNPSYIVKGFPMVRDVKPGGTFLINCQWTDDELATNLPADAKRYIAKNNIQRLPDRRHRPRREDRHGQAHQHHPAVRVLLAGQGPARRRRPPVHEGRRREVLRQEGPGHRRGQLEGHRRRRHRLPQVRRSRRVGRHRRREGRAHARGSRGHRQAGPRAHGADQPHGRRLAARLQVRRRADGQWELGASAYEKRGVAVMVPHWDESKCIQCNQCSFVCPHATIRPIVMNADEQAAAPEEMRRIDVMVPKNSGLTFTMAISPLDCMGCTNCAKVCPKGALTMVPQEAEADQAKVWDYAVNKVSEKKELVAANVKGSQFAKPYLEFSGSCAGCAETAYARLVTQVCGERMFISNATGCSSIWGNPAATSPFTVNECGHGPAWNNSLFEDNAEHGLGLALGYEAVQEKLVAETEQLLQSDCASDALKEAATAWLEAKGDTEGSKTAAAAYVAELEKADCDTAKAILADKAYLTKKAFWIFGGDGWAYDIGFGGLDHVLASGNNVNVFVFDTEVYSNTGGQASKASNIGQVAQFAAAGKVTKKKSLAEIAMSYGYVYVAQVAMGANMNQTLKAIHEAVAYDGPSLIIGYSPCEMHSIKKGGMQNCQAEMKKAVDCGYWNLFRFNPAAPTGKKFTLDSKEPQGGYQDFLMNEARYASLTRSFPERAKELFAENEEAAMARYAHLLKLKDLYADA